MHPNIVKLKEVIRENDELHLVCEYMDGNVYQVLRLHILGDSTCGRFRTDFVIEPRDDLGGSTCGFVELDVRTCRCSCFSSTLKIVMCEVIKDRVKTLPEEKVRNIMYQTFQALGWMHKHGSPLCILHWSRKAQSSSCCERFRTDTRNKCRLWYVY